MSKISNKLYVGTWVEARSRHFLKKHKISHVLVAAPEVDQFYKEKYIYKSMPLLLVDNFEILPWLEPAAEFCNNAIEEGTGLLIHDFKGDSRAVACVCAYIMRYFGFNFPETFKRISKKRPEVRINKFYASACRLYEEQLRNRGLQKTVGNISKMNIHDDDTDWKQNLRKSMTGNTNNSGNYQNFQNQATVEDTVPENLNEDNSSDCSKDNFGDIGKKYMVKKVDMGDDFMSPEQCETFYQEKYQKNRT